MHAFDPLKLDFGTLFDTVLSDTSLDRRLFYAAKIRRHSDSPQKSDLLIERQRALKAWLQTHGFETIIAGSVRGNYVADRAGKRTLVFREKGVDVRLAVDAVSMACDHEVTTAILCSSDSDLQPAIEQLKRRKVAVVYVGFEDFHNRGLSYTAGRTILIRRSELHAAYQAKQGRRKAA